MTADSGLRIALAQADFLVGDVAGNAAKAADLARRARDELAARVVVFPELTLTGYPPEDLLLRPALHAQVAGALAQLAQAVPEIYLVVGHPHPGRHGLHNSASVLFGGACLATYNKHQLPNYAVFDEKRYFVPGTTPCVVEMAGVPVGLTLCEDVWQPGPVAAARDAGARLILNLNASPFHVGKAGEREAVVRARVEEAGLPLVYVNLVGGQDELVFDGESFVMDSDGRVVVRLPAMVEHLAVVEFAANGALVPRPGAVAAHPDELASLYAALVLGVRDYVTKNGFKGAVLGLSGGIDSALTLAIAVDALGAEAVEAVMMPSRYTSDMSRSDAAQQAEAMGVRYRIVPIEAPFQTFTELLAEEFAGTEPDATEENLQARARGMILMAISNKFGKILLTTGNKSEMSVGYATLYGDMCGGFAPIKDVPKLLVYRLAAWRNAQAGGAVIPQRVIDRPPSAELRADQTDQDSLPPYEVLDPILERYIERDLGIDDIVAEGFERGTVARIAALVDRNEYKRRQAPPGVRISRRAFGRDRRYPITSGFRRD